MNGDSNVIIDVINKRPRIDLHNNNNSSSSSSNSSSSSSNNKRSDGKENDEKDENSYEFIQKSDVVEISNIINNDSSSTPTTTTTTTINPSTSSTTTTSSTPMKEMETFIPFTFCLDSFLQPEIIDMFHPTMNCNTSCAKTLRFKTFPKYLMMKMGRYYIRYVIMYVYSM